MMPLSKALLQALSEISVVRGNDAAVRYLVKLALSKGSLARHFLDIVRSGKETSGERMLHAIGGAANSSLLRPPGLKSGIAVYGLFSAEIGVGQSARRSVHAIRTTGIPYSSHNIADVQTFSNAVGFDTEPTLHSAFDTALIHLNADTLLEVLPLTPVDVFAGKRRIGVWHWELPVFPAKWASAFEKVHEVWTPSSYVAEGIRAACTLPVKVVPHGVQAIDIDARQARRELDLPESAFMFLTVFDSNSYVTRKNPIAVLDAFLDAFPRENARDVVLVVKCHGRGRRGGEFRELEVRAAADRRIILIDELFSEANIRRLHAACDVYMSLHRSEGYGLNIIECMAEGKVAIGTGFSGNLEFMNSENSILVPYAMRRILQGEYIYGEGQWWAEPDHAFAVDAMRWAVNADDRFMRLARQAREDTATKFSYSSVGKLIAESIGKSAHASRP